VEIDSTVPVANSCDDPDPTDAAAPEPGKVAVVAAKDNCYVVKSTSNGKSADGNHVFVSTRDPAGIRTRLCRPDSAKGNGGCPLDGTW
jgi:hypothetical protein